MHPSVCFRRQGPLTDHFQNGVLDPAVNLTPIQFRLSSARVEVEKVTEGRGPNLPSC